jgi:hypothetical protein
VTRLQSRGRQGDQLNRRPDGGRFDPDIVDAIGAAKATVTDADARAFVAHPGNGFAGQVQ